MFYLIGLGLGDATDITVKGLEIVKRAKRVYLEAYTSILTEEYYGRELILADRDMVETQADELLMDAENEDIVFLIVGDPFGATTHTDLVLRAVEKDIKYKVVHNASIMNAVGCCGLQTVSIVFWTEPWRPDSFYDKIKVNREKGMHTLCLLDIKVKEQTIENMMKGKKIFEPPRYMTFTEETVCVGLARIGADTQQIVAATLQEMTSVDLGGPLHSLVVPGHMHPLEMDMLRLFANSQHVKDLLKS
ncbi:hypothetical protein KUTeg_011400 [Tegillarca granosa]|uniref:diphthine methyl ester synthase n=1 Tax=Tegillarca granosa TaxID=220873 RepID=A0ABQ9F4B4_TEGGR|nr:hypothetical protein KUTeg_011400 [Tegillarca granosa]